jgi:hypothetical protein
MSIKSKTGIGIFALAMLLIGVVLVASASTNDSQDTPSKDVILDINDPNLQRTPLPNFGPHVFDELKKNPSILATKGVIPQCATQAERMNWLGKLDDIRVMVRDDLSPYAYPKGPVLGHGFGENGTFEVYLYKDMNVSDSQINEIYNVINKTGNKMNIQNVPVVFLKRDFVQDATASGYDDYHRPIYDGMQLKGQTGSIGSLGFAARTSDGTRGYVTAQHLGTSVGYQMYQPVNTNSVYAAGSVSIISGTHADACFVPYNFVTPYVYAAGSVKPVIGYCSDQPDNSWVGLAVSKSGRTTGVTSGSIVAIVDLDGSEGLGTYTDLIETNVQVQGGDSGGPLYITILDGVGIIGITKANWSGYSLFSSVYGINYDLGVLPINT